MRAHDFHALCELAYAQAGIKLGDEKRALVSARVGKRLRALNLRDERDYLEVLRTDDGGELSEFLDVISTHFTSFFREPAHFELLVDDLRQRMDRGQRQFTVWCAAASSGEEPYTIALVLDRLFSGRDVEWRVLATDLSRGVLALARRGQYTAAQLESVDREALSNCFVKQRLAEGDEPLYEVRAELKQHLTFARLNLARTPFPMRGPFDAVLCRNVMIYFDAPVRQALVRELERLVRPGGLVMVGHSETLGGLESGLRLSAPSIYRRPG